MATVNISTSTSSNRPAPRPDGGNGQHTSQHVEHSVGNAPGSSFEAQSRGGADNNLLPAVTVPTGGGAIRGMNEAFDVDMASGTASLKIPIPVSQCLRWGTPNLSLEYDSGGGNGVFGMGWTLKGLSSIERKTVEGLPKYIDNEDAFLLDGDELVPVFRKLGSGEWALMPDGTHQIEENVRGDYVVRLYRTRLDHDFDRIERWTHIQAPQDVHWRVISSQNETEIFGRAECSRIAADGRIFQWLLCEAYDSHGGAQLVEWKTEDSANVDTFALHEQNRTNNTRSSSKLLKRIKYGNATPNRTAADQKTILPAAELSWLFEVVFDYGEHDPVSPRAGDDARTAWSVRKDPISTYKPGFEVRVYRLCRRILMYHHFDKELQESSTLVASLDLGFHEEKTISFLQSVCHVGYSKDAQGQPITKRLPPLELEYTTPPTEQQLQTLFVQNLVSGSSSPFPKKQTGELQWVDLAGDGTTGVLCQYDGAWYYKRNLSTAVASITPHRSDTNNESMQLTPEFGETAEVVVRPNLGSEAEGGGQASLVDLTGDGSTDLMIHSDGIAGYFLGTYYPEGGLFNWQTFEPFTQLPGIDFQDPNLRMIDLTGDGRADILITTEDLFVWYPARGIQGFGSASTVAAALDEERGPRVVFSDSTETITLCDMSGDGMVDIVRMRNSDICYWPNLGYGQFGPRVTMDNSPILDHDNSFHVDQRRVLLCDVDGSGTHDLVYFHSSGATLYYNQSGNSWSTGIALESLVPAFDTLTRVAAVDLFGTGTACLVFTSASPATAVDFGFVDLMSGIKPHLLKQWKDNRGSQVRITYKSSTAYYLEDEKEGNPWATRIPFPVHCVDAVLQQDLINRRSIMHRYRYHHGHFDGEEREFRGFGMVEEWDTEEFDTIARVSIQTVLDDTDRALHSAPLHTKTWFHVGAFQALRAARTVYAKAFHPWSRLREAIRVLSGRRLHGEEYDAGQQDGTPFSVEDVGYSVRMLQPRGQNKRAVFQCYENESYSAHYEHDSSDPMISQEFNFKVDHFGNVVKSAHIAQGRQKRDEEHLSAAEILLQQRDMIVYLENSYTNVVDTADDYLGPHPSVELKYELSAVAPSHPGRFTYGDFAGSGDFKPIQELAIIEYQQSLPKFPCKRLLANQRTLYRSDNLQTPLAVGVIESLALPWQSYRLCLTSDSLQLYENGPGRTLSSQMLKQAGYHELDTDVSWWIPGPRISYTSSDAGPEEELAAATASFFRPRRLIDPFGNCKSTSYDSYHLLVERTEDAVGNTSIAQNDYRVLAPHKICDANRNTVEIAWDALGRLAGTAEAGKGSGDVDSLEGFNPDPSPDDIEGFLADPLNQSQRMIAAASVRYLINDEAFYKHQTPICQAMIERLQHGFQKSRVHIQYQDAHGTCIQQTSPSTKNRWITSGWTVVNNKGLPVQEFDPTFTESADFRSGAKSDHCTLTFYDARGRPLAKLLPDHTWSKVVYENWRTTTYDSNDLIAANPAEDPDVGRAIKSLPTDVYLPTWYDSRANGQLGVAQKMAAEKAFSHRSTPSFVYYDSLGQDMLHVTNAGAMLLKTKFYDMQGRIMLTETMDHTYRLTLHDVNGAPILDWRGDKRRERMAYDALRRLVKVFLVEGDAPEVCVFRTVFGDEKHAEIEDAERDNLQGHVFKQYDQSGVQTRRQYDMDGNCVAWDQHLTEAYREVVDWSVVERIKLDKRFQFKAEFDAIGRIQSRNSADGTVTQYKYEDNGLLFSVKSQLPGSDWTCSLSAVEYDEHLREIMRTRDINATKTFMTYDPLTHRLIRKTTCCRDKTMQDVQFTYDAVGNLVHQEHLTNQRIYFNNGPVPAVSQYTYDAAYRLVEESGREHLGQTKGKAPAPGFVNLEPGTGKAVGPADASAMARYTETYAYDEAGNMTHLRHVIHDKTTPGWDRFFFYESPSNLELSKFNNRLTSSGFVHARDAGYSHEYDEHGNVKSMPGLACSTWDHQNQLRSSSSQRTTTNRQVETVWYVYNISGTRVRKVVEKQLPNGNLVKTKETLYLEEFSECTKYNSQGTLTLQCKSMTVKASNSDVLCIREQWTGPDQEAKGLPSLLVRFQHTLVLDSIIFEVDDEANLLSYEEYTAYGTTVFQAGLARAPKRYRFAGKERDTETGFYYNQRRYYVPWLCRWLNCDPLGTADGFNAYVYVGCNPVGYVDHEGTVKSGTRSKNRLLAGWSKMRQARLGPAAERVRQAPHHKGTKSSPGAFARRMEKGKDIEKICNRITFDQSHLIPYQYKKYLEHIINVDMWCIRIQSNINQVEMRAKGTTEISRGLDERWKLFFKEKPLGKESNLERMQSLKTPEEWSQARSEILKKLKDFTSDYILPNAMLDYRVPFDGRFTLPGGESVVIKNRFDQLGAYMPEWGTLRFYPKQHTTKGENDGDARIPPPSDRYYGSASPFV
ncbi:virulence plasmid 65kDa B protein-domain-containing protein [Cladorrhinum sp. PSN259]|nr:virulence plasmid 65kDa B protein-domain-containing protein [Cladorrhinum sp. PSN259]